MPINNRGENVELTQITRNLWNANNDLESDKKQLKALAWNKADTERKYKVALAAKILNLREEKMPATLIPDLARGNKEVADLRFDRDLARVMYDSFKAAMESARVQVSALQSILKHQTDI